jgi:hypothetical protein
MKHSERFALDHFLSRYPRDLPFDEVIDIIHDDEEDQISVWDLAENCSKYSLVEMINDLRHHFECVASNMIMDLGQLKEGEKHDA